MAKQRRLIEIVSLILLLVSGCYDGWESDQGNSVGVPDPPSSSEAPIFHIQMMSFFLSPSAVADGTCFGATGTEQFRLAEWSERQAAIQESIPALAVSSSFIPGTISTLDCVSLKKIETFATNSSLDVELTDDPSDRPIVVIAAVFWDDDVAGTMSSAVLQRDWATARMLRSKGRRVISLNYFSLSNKTTGKLSSWLTTRKTSSAAPGVLEATPIDSIDPTSNGQAARRSTAVADAAALKSWILSEAERI